MGIVTDIVLPVALAFIMFALGLGLTFADFARVARQPRDFLIGAASQLILLPAIAWLLVSVWSLPPELALGVMIIAAAPGGVTSNILTALARGDVALSISLTAVISLVCEVCGLESPAKSPLVVMVKMVIVKGANDGKKKMERIGMTKKKLEKIMKACYKEDFEEVTPERRRFLLMKVFCFLGVKRFNDIQKLKRKNVVFRRITGSKCGWKGARRTARKKAVSLF